MKKLLSLLLSLWLLAAVPVFGQGRAGTPVMPAETLVTFDLDFPGGTPAELIAAIQKAMGRPLNAIVAVEHANVKLPPLKMNGVNVPQLFSALGKASPTRQIIGNSSIQTEFGFRADNPITDSSVWYFYYNGYTDTVKQSKLYLLTPYLEARGLTVDDITTAIQTNWKLAGIAPAALSFHRETNLLIAVGDRSQLAGIDAVLLALKPDVPPPPAATSPAQPAAPAPAAPPAPPAARGARAGGRG